MSWVEVSRPLDSSHNIQPVLPSEPEDGQGANHHQGQIQGFLGSHHVHAAHEEVSLFLYGSQKINVKGLCKHEVHVLNVFTPPSVFFCGRQSWRLIHMHLICRPFLLPLLLCWCLVAQSCLTLGNPMDYSPTRPLCPWGFAGKNTGVGCQFLLQGLFPTQGLNLCLLHCQADSLPLSHQRTPSFGLPISNSAAVFKKVWCCLTTVRRKHFPIKSWLIMDTLAMNCSWATLSYMDDQ